MYQRPACPWDVAFASAAVAPQGPVQLQVPSLSTVNGIQGLGSTVAPSAFDLQVGPSLTGDAPLGFGTMPAGFGSKVSRQPTAWGPDSRLVYPGGQVPTGDLAGYMTDPITGVTYACRTAPMQLPQIPTDGRLFVEAPSCTAGKVANRHLEALTGVSALTNPRQCKQEVRREWVDALEGLQIPVAVLNQQVAAAQAANAAQQVFFTNRETPAGFVEGGPPAGYIGDNYMLRLHMDTQTLNDYEGGGTSILPDRPANPDLSLLMSTVTSSATRFGGPMAPIVRVLREDKADTRPRPIPDALQDASQGTAGAALPPPVSTSVRVAGRLADAGAGAGAASRIAPPQVPPDYQQAIGAAGTMQPVWTAGGKRLLPDATPRVAVSADGDAGGCATGIVQTPIRDGDRAAGLGLPTGRLHVTAAGGVAESVIGAGDGIGHSTSMGLRAVAGGGAGDATAHTRLTTDGGSGLSAAAIGGTNIMTAPRRAGAALMDVTAGSLRTHGPDMQAEGGANALATAGVAGGLKAPNGDAAMGAFRTTVTADSGGGGGGGAGLPAAWSDDGGKRMPVAGGVNPAALLGAIARGTLGDMMETVGNSGAQTMTAAMGGPGGQRSASVMAPTFGGRAVLDGGGNNGDGYGNGHGSLLPAISTGGRGRFAADGPSFRHNVHASTDGGNGLSEGLAPATAGPRRGNLMAVINDRNGASWEGGPCSFWLAPVVDGDRGDRSITDQDERLTNTSMLHDVLRCRYSTPMGPDIARWTPAPPPPTAGEIAAEEANAASAQRACGTAAYLDKALTRKMVCAAMAQERARAHTPLGQVCVDGYDTDY